jgi:hypothetical protein
LWQEEKVHPQTAVAFGSAGVPLGRSGSTWLKDLLTLPGVGKIDREIISKKTGPGTNTQFTEGRLLLCAR